jgi:hypothetical protein
MAEVMRACLLRAALSRNRSAAKYVLGNPKAWLGTAYHEVLEKLAIALPEVSSLDAVVEQLWSAAIATQHERALAHSLDARFGAPTTWPGYHLARAAVRLRAEEMLRASVPPGGIPRAPSDEDEIREKEFTAFEGKLIGRPDLIRFDEIVDYKSGAVNEFDEATQTDVVKAAYVRQLRIYGFLAQQVLGRWLARGVLLPLAGAGVEVALDPADCTREAVGAVGLLDDYNARVRSGASAESFAQASPASCKWCPFKLICPAFWQAASPSWSGELEGAAVEGVLLEAVRTIHGGAALAISLDLQRGTEVPQRAEIAPLNPSVHSSVPQLRIGERVRVVGLRTRKDGKLMPTARTIVASLGNLSSLDTTQAAQGTGPNL